jgi:CRP/FNR family transcriptional regulator, cyclic AMP receptor protein
MATLQEMLHASLWAKGLTAEQMRRVQADLTERVVHAGGFAAHKGEQVDAWLGVVDGLLKMSSVSADGRAATFTGLPYGAWFGEGTLLKNERRKYDLIALRDSRIAVMPRATFQWLLDTSIAFNRFLLVQINERLGQFIAMVEYDRLLEPDARVARCIAELRNPILYPGSGNTMKLAQEELGYLTGVSRQRVNQALQALEREALLKVEYGGVTILDLEGLRRFGA